MAEDNKQDGVPSNVKFHYIKSNYFRVAHADGLVGSITPGNDVFVTFYNERTPLPDYVTFEVTPSGALGKEIESERITQSDGIVREMEVGLVFDIGFARSFALWLTEVVQQFENPNVSD